MDEWFLEIDLTGEGQISLSEFASWYRDNIENTKESWGNSKKLGAESMVSGGRAKASTDAYNSN
jgi:hypothetical protein